MWLPQGFFQATGSVDDLAWSSGELVGFFDDPSPYLDFNFVNPNFAAASDTSQIPTVLWQAPDAAAIWPAWWDGSGEALTVAWNNFDDGEIRPFGARVSGKAMQTSSGGKLGFGSAIAALGGSIIASDRKISGASLISFGGAWQTGTTARFVSFVAGVAGAPSIVAIPVKRGGGIAVVAAGGADLSGMAKRGIFNARPYGGGFNSGASVKRASWAAQSATGGFSADTLLKRSTFLGVDLGGGAALSITVRRAAGTGFVQGAGASAGAGAKRFNLSGLIGAGGRSGGITVKISSANPKNVGAGSQFATGQKITSAITLSALSAGGGDQVAQAVIRATFSASARSGGFSSGATSKRAGWASLSAGAGKASAANFKVGQSLGLVAGGGGSAPGNFVRRVSAVALAAAGGIVSALFGKRMSASGINAGAGFVIVTTSPPPLPDVAVIAGLWLQSVGIDGTVPGGVTTRSIEIDGRTERDIAIEGRRFLP